MPLPVFTVAASILMFRTPVVTSGDLNLSEASNGRTYQPGDRPLTENLMALSSGVVAKTGACVACSRHQGKRQKAENSQSHGPECEHSRHTVNTSCAVNTTVAQVFHTVGIYGCRCLCLLFPKSKPPNARHLDRRRVFCRRSGEIPVFRFCRCLSLCSHPAGSAVALLLPLPVLVH